MSKKILCTLPFEDTQKQFLETTYPNVKFTYATSATLTREEILSSNAVVGFIPNEYLDCINHLEWIQLPSSGYDQFLDKGILGENTILCNAGDAYGVSVAEHLLAMELSVVKKFPQYRDYQNKTTWTDLGQVLPLHDLNILVVGLGAIGTNFAKYMNVLGNNIIGVKNNISTKPDFVKEVYTLDKLDELLPKADIVVLSIPMSPVTKGLMNKERFSKMKNSAYFFNVGRGGLVETQDLIFVLENNIIAGAGVDVTHIEPLPSDDALWNTKNLFITPHVSGGFHIPETLIKIQGTAIENIEAYLKGNMLKNRVK